MLGSLAMLIFAVPNGLRLSPDGDRVYVSETYSRDVHVFDVTVPGVLGGRRRLYASEGAHGCVGLAVDGAGNVCVASLGEAFCITVIGADGEVRTRFIRHPCPRHVRDQHLLRRTGPAHRLRLLVRSGLLYSVPGPWPGLRLNFAR